MFFGLNNSHRGCLYTIEVDHCLMIKLKKLYESCYGYRKYVLYIIIV